MAIRFSFSAPAAASVRLPSSDAGMSSGAPFHRARILGRTVAFIGCLLTLPANAVGSCLSLAQTEYERIYCQVFAKGEGAKLPSLEDFRRNDPGIQALLLKRPAARAGLELPPPAKTAANKPLPVPAAAQSSAPEPAEQAETQSAGAAKPEGSLSHCRLEGDVISCPDRRFYLTTNQPNAALEPGALGDSQMMGLPPFSGNGDDDAEVRAYLSDAYEIYIPRMMAIGLGGATMSFSQFYHGFYRHEEQGVDFAQRLEATYQFLKQDKEANAVKARFHGRLPETIGACMTLSAEIVVCDDVGTNWVYAGEK